MFKSCFRIHRFFITCQVSGNSRKLYSTFSSAESRCRYSHRPNNSCIYNHVAARFSIRAMSSDQKQRSENSVTEKAVSKILEDVADSTEGGLAGQVTVQSGEDKATELPSEVGATKVGSKKVSGRIRPSLLLKRLKQESQFTSRSSVPSEVFLQVVQSGCRGMGKCVFLSTDNTCYFFNCPEGTQRKAGEHRLRFSKIEHVFFTQATWTNSGGFPGLTLSLDSAGCNKVTVHGPPHLKQIFQAIRPFSEETTEIEIAERHYTDVKYEDNALTVEYVPIFSLEETEDVDDDSFENLELPGDNPIPVIEHSMKNTTKRLSVAFVCRLKPKPGALNPEKCYEFGVPRGPLLGELQRGKDVVLEDGTVVAAKDVTEEAEIPPNFVVVDCPNIHFLDSLVNCKQFREFQSESKTSEMELIVHMTPTTVFQSAKYQKWMADFGIKTKHLILNSMAVYLPHSEGIYRAQSLLNYVHPESFPRLHYHHHRSADLFPLENRPGGLCLAEPFLRFSLRPLKGFERDTLFEFDHEAVLDSARQANSNFEEKNKIFKNFLKKSACSGQKFPELIFLGTGSAVPSKYRNVSGTILNVDSETSILLDCGESTSLQMFDLLGPEECDKALTKLQAVFISHLHQDHHLGLFSLLRERRDAFDRLGLEFQPCYLLAPAPLFSMHRMYSRLIENIGTSYKIISTKIEEKGSKKELRELGDKMGLREIFFVKVDHPKMASGVVVITGDKKKIVYSGDTRPCSQLIKWGQGADLLIHEATFDDSLMEDAVRKRHSTTGEALDVAKKMGAKFTILTHFSSRYSKMPLITDKFNENVGVAFDNMRVSLGDLHVLPELLPVLKELFLEDYEDMAKKIEIKRLKKMIDEEQDNCMNDRFATAQL